VFVLSCCRDICQERMTMISQSSPDYLPSALLSRAIATYNQNLKDLLDFLRSMPSVLSEINTEDSFARCDKALSDIVLPTVLTVRDSGSDKGKEVKEQILQNLVSEQGFIRLDTKALCDLEVERQTNIGLQLKANPEDIEAKIALLKRIIYSGIDGHNKFVVNDFLNDTEEARWFEIKCAKLAAVLYASDKGPTVELASDKFNSNMVETFFSRFYKVKTMTSWDASVFDEHLGKRTKWGLVTGRSYSGADQVAKDLCNMVNGSQISMKQIEEDIRKSLSTDEEPFEGEVPIADVEKAVVEQVHADKAAGKNLTYVWDSWKHKNIADFLKFA